MKVALAVVSGALCALQFRRRLDAGWFGFGLLDFGVPGALFGAAILCPYLVPGRFAAAHDLAGFVLASFVGVTIVLVAARLLVPLRVTAAFWLLGLAASLIGGLAMYAGFELLWRYGFEQRGRLFGLARRGMPGDPSRPRVE